MKRGRPGRGWGAGRCWTQSPPYQPLVSLPRPAAAAAAGAGGGAGSPERAATQPREQRAAAAEGRERPRRVRAGRGGQMLAAGAGEPSPRGQQPRRPPGRPSALRRPRAGGAGRGAAGAEGAGEPPRAPRPRPRRPPARGTHPPGAWRRGGAPPAPWTRSAPPSPLKILGRRWGDGMQGSEGTPGPPPPNHLQCALRGSPLESAARAQWSSEAAAFSGAPAAAGDPCFTRWLGSLGRSPSLAGLPSPGVRAGATGRTALPLPSWCRGSNGDPSASPGLDACWWCHQGPFGGKKGLKINGHVQRQRRRARVCARARAGRG